MKNPIFYRIFSLFLVLFLLIPMVSAADLNGARGVITDAIAREAESAELESYKISTTELETLMDQLRQGNVLPWYYDNYSYSYGSEDNLVRTINLLYKDPSEYNRSAYEREVARVLEEAVFPGMSQWQIALSVHDYLASHYAYDETYTYYTGYDLLVRKTAVCEGYALAYMDILKRAGLEAVRVSSEDMNHTWTLVKIGSDWYHVDVTWDDPISNVQGRVVHTYFLQDDAGISDADHAHYNWVAPHTANNPDMNDNVFWQQTNSPICYENADTCYLRIDEANEHWIYRRDSESGAHTQIAYFDAGYIDIGYGSYHYFNYGLSLWNGRLYYSDMENVYSINTDGSDLQVVYSYNAEANGMYIFGSFVDDGIIYLTLSNHDNNLVQTEVTVPGYTPHTHDYQTDRQEATCTTAGIIRYVCTCGDVFDGEAIPAQGHTYDNGIITKPATETETGITTYTCLKCGDQYTDSIPKLQAKETVPPETRPQITLPQITIPERPTDTNDKKDGFSILSLLGTIVKIALLLVVLVIALIVFLIVKAVKKKKQPKPTSIFLDEEFDPYGSSAGTAADDTYGSDSGDSTGDPFLF